MSVLFVSEALVKAQIKGYTKADGLAVLTTPG